MLLKIKTCYLKNVLPKTKKYATRATKNGNVLLGNEMDAGLVVLLIPKTYATRATKNKNVLLVCVLLIPKKYATRVTKNGKVTPRNVLLI